MFRSWPEVFILHGIGLGCTPADSRNVEGDDCVVDDDCGRDLSCDFGLCATLQAGDGSGGGGGRRTATECTAENYGCPSANDGFCDEPDGAGADVSGDDSSACAIGSDGADCGDCRFGPGGSSCADAPCLNGGTCIDTSVGFACSCLDGFNGARCEIQQVTATQPSASAPPTASAPIRRHSTTVESTASPSNMTRFWTETH